MKMSLFLEIIISENVSNIIVLILQIISENVLNKNIDLFNDCTIIKSLLEGIRQCWGAT
jgi:hypothetical protein